MSVKSNTFLNLHGNYDINKLLTFPKDSIIVYRHYISIDYTLEKEIQLWANILELTVSAAKPTKI